MIENITRHGQNWVRIKIDSSSKLTLKSKTCECFAVPTNPKTARKNKNIPHAMIVFIRWTFAITSCAYNAIAPKHTDNTI